MRFLLSFFLFSFFLVSFSYSQDEVSENHLLAARSMLEATRFTDRFDAILPDVSIALKRQLTNNEPDKASDIDAIVDEEALLLAVRRGALETEAVRLIAESYTIEELNAMTDFFSSPAGQRYLTGMPIVFQDLDKASRIWRVGIERDLTQNVVRRINELTR